MRKLLTITLMLFVGFVSNAQQNCATWTEGCTSNGGYEWVVTLAPGASISFDIMTPPGAWTMTQTGTNPEVWTVYGVDPNPASILDFALASWSVTGPCTQTNFDVGVDCLIDNCPNCINPPCNLIASVPANILCDDNNTPGNPADDTFTFDMTMNESSGGTSWIADDPLSSSGNYGTTNMGPYLISNGTLNFTVTDSDNSGCTAAVIVTPPAPCSVAAGCSLSITAATQDACNDNGTPTNPSDDFFMVTVNATATNGGASNQFIVSGGMEPDTFDYAIGGMVAVPSDGNTYTLTFADADDAGCNATTTVSDTPCCLLDVTTMLVPESVVDGNNGEIHICINNDEEPFDIVITPETGASIYEVPGNCLYNYIVAGLPEGSYDLSITGANTCTTTLTGLDITAPPCTGFQLADVIASDATCHGADNGSLEINLQDVADATSITVDLGNGIPPMTFTDLSQMPLTMTDVPPGTYDVALFDNNGCEVTYIYNPLTINEPDPIIVSNTSTNTTSTLVSDGTISVCVSDNIGGSYTITTNPVAGTVADADGPCDANYLISDLPAGTYEIIATDDDGCSATSVAIVNDPTCPITIDDLETTDIICGGDSTGIISLVVGNAVAPYSISLDGGMTFSATQNDPDFTINDLPAGGYDIVVTDGNGCSQTLGGDVVLTETTPISLDAEVDHVNVLGGASGSINVCLNGGAEEYDLTVSPNTGILTQLGSSGLCVDNYGLTGLIAGIYEFTVTDTIGCSSVFEVEVLEPTCLGISIQDIVVDSVSCYGENNGSITIVMNGGTAPYTYQLSGIQPYTTSNASHTFNGLEAGEYELSVTDNNGCFIPNSPPIEVLEPEALASSIVSIPPCEGESNGVICLNPENGTPWYSYNVEFDGDPVTVTEGTHPECGGEFYVGNVEAGSYFVELVDDNGCLAHGITSVSEIIVAASAETEDDCTGTAAGSIDLSAGGGTAPYSYEWSTGSMDEDLMNLEEGSYSVTVTDTRGCTAISNFPVGLLDLDLSFAVAETCEEQDAGAIITAVTNGVPQYAFNWSNGTNTNNETISGLPLGDYSVTVTDARGCTALGSTTVTEYDMMTEMVVENTCVGQNNGFVGTLLTNGIPEFVYAWSDGSNGGVINGVAPGDYTVTITDVNGCSAVGSGTVTEYTLNPNLEIADVCSGGDSGAITATVENAENPINYIWSNGASGNPVGNLSAGEYTVSVTDALGCEVTATGTVNEFSPPTATASEDVTIQQGEFTTLSVTATGGSGPYTYQWIPAPIDDPNASITGAAPSETTTYTVIVTDSNGCTAEDEVTVTVVPPVILVMPNAFSPNGDQDNDLFRPFVPNDNADIEVFQIFDRWGKLLYDDPSGGWNGKFNDKDQPVGTYVYVLEYNDLLDRKTSLKGHFALIR